MDDLISRQVAIEAIDDYLNEYSGLDEEGYHGEKWCAMAEAKMVIENLQSAQPELIEKAAYIRGFEQGRTQDEISLWNSCKFCVVFFLHVPHVEV